MVLFESVSQLDFVLCVQRIYSSVTRIYFKNEALSSVSYLTTSRNLMPSLSGNADFVIPISVPQLPSSTKRVEVRGDGMEQGLLKQIEKMNFRTQMEVFYTAYSKARHSCLP